MNDWKSWDLHVWNERMLDHFFLKKGDQESAVVTLLITAEELTHVTGDHNANIDEVRRAFVNAVLSSIRDSKSLLKDAICYHGWPGSPPRESRPPFVAHLLFTCIAASESSDDLENEASFVGRLRDLTLDQLSDNSLQDLPKLWENLAHWLDKDKDKYRKLILPDPGGYTRIGYTTRLAFPDRRDQKQLSELLDHEGIAGNEPPVSRVLSLIASRRHEFRRSFLDAYDEFRESFQACAGRSTARLAEHRFWAAVREASFRGRGETGFSEFVPRFTLLGYESDERVTLYVVTDQLTTKPEVEFEELPEHINPWRFVLTPKGSQSLETSKQVTQDVLNGTIFLPRLSSSIMQGLLPFHEVNGQYELAGQTLLSEVSFALVREDIAQDLFCLLGYAESKIRPSSYDGWVQVHDPILRTIPFEKLDGTPLCRTWILQDSLCPVTVRLRGGIRADDEWLGIHPVLPCVVAPGATKVVLEGLAGTATLANHENGNWYFPPQDLTGKYTIIATIDENDIRRTIRFCPAPASEDYKPPTDPNAWIVEGISGTATLSSSHPFVLGYCDADCTQLCERTAYLGSDVGVFVVDPDSAAWIITNFAGRLLGACGSKRGGDTIPARQVMNPHTRRQWRKLLFDKNLSYSDLEFERARRETRPYALGDSHLIELELEQSIPNISPTRLPPPLIVVDRLVRVVSGRAAMRSGIRWREWIEIGRRVLDIDVPLFERVTRAWMEAGLIDIVSFARWRQRMVFVKRPRLVAFKIGDHVGATLLGLTLPTTIEEVRRTAESLELLIEDRFSVSPLVPGTISLRASDARVLEKLARVCRLELCWLDIEGLKQDASSRYDGTTIPPGPYELVIPWPNWSLKNSENSNLVVEHHIHSRLPDFWTVSHFDKQLWFYDLNMTRAWAATLLDEPIVNIVDDTFLQANHSFLPLPIARAISVLGSGLSGPVDSDMYRYPVGTTKLREVVLEILLRSFNLTRLTVSTSEQATG